MKKTIFKTKKETISKIDISGPLKRIIKRNYQLLKELGKY